MFFAQNVNFYHDDHVFRLHRVNRVNNNHLKNDVRRLTYGKMYEY